MAFSKQFPTDHHGPLITPPPEVLATAPGSDKTRRAVRNRAVTSLLTQQQDAWLSLATDGELDSASTPPGSIEAARFALANCDIAVKVRLLRSRSGRYPALAANGQVQALLDLGVRYVQLDGACYGPLLHHDERARLAAMEIDPDAEIEQFLEVDGAALKGLRLPAGARVAICLHDPQDSNSQPLARDLNLDAFRRICARLPVNRFVFDCGDGLDTDFGFLRLLPPDCQAALGLFDPNQRTLPPSDALVAMLRLAAEQIDADRLALIPRFALMPREDETTNAAWERQLDVFELLLDATSRAWGVDL